MCEMQIYFGNDVRRLIKLEDMHHYEGDVNYVEGCVDLRIQGRPIFIKDCIDDINHLIPLFMDELIEIKKTGIIESGYASFDWPYEMKILSDDKVFIKAGFPDEPGYGEAVCSLKSLIAAFKPEAAKFYQKLKEFNVYTEEDYNKDMRLLDTL